jgi:hypothetical protein
MEPNGESNSQILPISFPLSTSPLANRIGAIEREVIALRYKSLFSRGGGGGGGGGSSSGSSTYTPTIIDVSTYAGGNLGSQLTNALSALPSWGGVLDCRRLTGVQTISSTVTIGKLCQILFGASVITCTTGAAGAIKIISNGNPPLGRGVWIEGSGYETVFQAAGGVAPVLWIAGADPISLPDVSIRNLTVNYTSDNAANVGVKVSGFAERFALSELSVLGAGALGKGIVIDSSLVGLIQRCHVTGFEYGGHQFFTGGMSALPNANVWRDNIIDGCKYGLVLEDGFSNAVYGNTIQDNSTYGFWIKSGGGHAVGVSGGNWYENVLGVNVQYDAAYNGIFTGDQFANAIANSKDFVITSVASVDFRSCFMNHGYTIGATSTVHWYDGYRGGADTVIGAGKYYIQIGNVISTNKGITVTASYQTFGPAAPAQAFGCFWTQNGDVLMTNSDGVFGWCSFYGRRPFTRGIMLDADGLVRNYVNTVTSFAAPMGWKWFGTDNTPTDVEHFFIDVEHKTIKASVRLQYSKGADVVAANDLTLGLLGNLFIITGNTQINAITTANWQAGSEITLIFTGTPTVMHNTAGGAGTAVIFLAGSAPLVAANNTVLKLVYDGTQWQEVSRKVA